MFLVFVLVGIWNMKLCRAHMLKYYFFLYNCLLNLCLASFICSNLLLLFPLFLFNRHTIKSLSYNLYSKVVCLLKLLVVSSRSTKYNSKNIIHHCHIAKFQTTHIKHAQRIVYKLQLNLNTWAISIHKSIHLNLTTTPFMELCI